ncbi:MAG: hypothetical protein K2X90_02700 [Candidatus Babeliaceae bacterium]|nr:hypothetical protein [Candidatus Babeliaceae bacterium]
MKFNFFKKQATPFIFFIFFLAAFFVRATVFYFYIQHEERYCQPDTQSYTMPALAMHHGKGMISPNGTPVFWRTPGYPFFLAPFYALSSSNSWDFALHENAHKAALWLQILWCSLLPILLYFLAWFLTHSLALAYTLAIIGVGHPGFILASTFLLTDGPAQLFFVMFLICLLRNFRFKSDNKSQYVYLTGAALALSIYTWMRPMGQFVGIATVIVLCFSHFSITEKIKQSLFFITLFALSLSPWFIRNYQLTGKIFFCPLFGLYFNVFNAPKIRARIERITHEEAWKRQCKQAELEVYKEYQEYARIGDKRVIVNEIVCMRPALPWMLNYPHYFIYDWIAEVCKTTFDLYSYQMLALYNNCFKWDPLVEYLDEKLADTLFKKELPLGIRLIAFVELFFELLLWIGIFSGLFMLFDRKFREHFFTLWIPCGIIMGAVLFQTGGFGYARLRLPIEPLIILLGLVFWVYIFSNPSKKNGKTLRTLAQ